MDVGSPIATSKGVIDVVTNVWKKMKKIQVKEGKTGSIDVRVRHFEVSERSWIHWQVVKETEY